MMYIAKDINSGLVGNTATCGKPYVAPLRSPLYQQSLPCVRSLLNAPQSLYFRQGLWGGAYDLSSLSEQNRKSNRS